MCAFTSGQFGENSGQVTKIEKNEQKVAVKAASMTAKIWGEVTSWNNLQQTERQANFWAVILSAYGTQQNCKIHFAKVAKACRTKCWSVDLGYSDETLILGDWSIDEEFKQLLYVQVRCL